MALIFFILACLSVIYYGSVKGKMKCDDGCQFGAIGAFMFCIFGMAFPEIATGILLCIIALNFIKRLIKKKQ